MPARHPLQRESRALFLVCLFACLRSLAFAADYHVDSETGDDTRDGRAPDSAWRTFAPANSRNFAPGDRILLRSGRTWRGGSLAPGGSGAPGNPIAIGAYGEGPRPALHGDGRVRAVIRLFNQSHWEIEGLEITNTSPLDRPPAARGIEVAARDAGWVSHLVFRNLHIHDINGPDAKFSDADVTLKSMGAIGLAIEGNAVPTAWDGVLVEDCHIHDVSFVGFANTSTWTTGHRDNDPSRWHPSRNIVIRRNLIERTARDGVIVRAAVRPVIEHNRFLECAIEGNGVGCFTFHTDDALIQFNEAAYTRYNPGDADAMGFDSDWNCRRTVIQYNYSHHNDLGFVLLCNNGRGGFNEDTVVRYNISYADGGNAIRFSGPVTGARVYNNTFILAPDMANPVPGDPPRAVYFKSWNGWARGAFLTNNLFIDGTGSAGFDLGEAEQIRFLGNFVHGKSGSDDPAGPARATEDPLLPRLHPAGADRAAIVEAFTPGPGSPLFRAGFAQPDQPARDFAGRPVLVSDDGRVDVGAISVPTEADAPDR